MYMTKIKLHWQILIALLLALLAGSLSGKQAGVLGVSFYAVYGFIGDLFLNALKMLIVPLIVSSLITAMASIGSVGAFGRIGVKTLVYFLSTTLIAVLLGLALVNLTTPGLIDGQPAKELIGLSEDTAAVTEQVQGKSAQDLVNLFLRMIPANVVAAAVEGEMLGLIFFSLLFGYFITRIPKRNGEVLLSFWQGVFEVMMRITDWVMRFAPLGVFALVAKVAAATGLAAIQPLLMFFFTVLLGLAIHFFGVLPLLVKLLGRVSPVAHYRAMAPALFTAFSTASSSATLPLTLECLEKNARVSNRVTGFVAPLGATVNMDGTALYECVAVLFIAQAYGVELNLATQSLVVVLALLTSIGVAGIPAASLVAIVVILSAVGLPAEGIGLILAVDRLLDMCRTTVNV
ncbi:MAG TPA: dicarboxylate/amino acid:cation symporter, partial [Gammaproteobacteria bacterium]|nr:dicarboxylate/amino acid:cation symporter [Gammaproteobacteria bacterium]